MASMKDVARLASVSESTVSRVLNQSLPVEQDTRLRVQDAIRKLNYRPNLLAKGLRNRSGKLIGLVVPEIVHHTFASFIQFIEESVVARGCGLILGNHKNNPELEESFIDDLIRRNVDGIIFSRVSDESRVMRLINQTGIPVVVIDRAVEQEEVASVVLDNHGPVCSQGSISGSAGHRKIACVTGPLKISLCRERLAGLDRSPGAVSDQRRGGLDFRRRLQVRVRISGRPGALHSPPRYNRGLGAERSHGRRGPEVPPGTWQVRSTRGFPYGHGRHQPCPDDHSFPYHGCSALFRDLRKGGRFVASSKKWRWVEDRKGRHQARPCRAGLDGVSLMFFAQSIAQSFAERPAPKGGKRSAQVPRNRARNHDGLHFQRHETGGNP